MATKTKEIYDYVTGEYDLNGQIPYSKALSKSEIEILDLLGEGEIHGLVSGEYSYGPDCKVGDYGFKDYVFKPFVSPVNNPFGSYLRSIYWNEVPLINNNGQYNFQNIEIAVVNGLQNGSLLNTANRQFFTSITRQINERLRASDLNSKGELISKNSDYAKIYTILNPACSSVIVSVKVNRLSKLDQENTSSDTYGTAIATEVTYKIYYKPLYERNLPTPYGPPISRTIKGKVTYGYIQSTKIDFPRLPTELNDYLIGWEIKLERDTPESVTSFILNQTYVESLTEIYADYFSYPNSAIVRSRFDAEYFSQIPSRAFDTRLLKVKVPNNYDPISKTYGTNVSTYENQDGEWVPVNKTSEIWDGDFKRDSNGDYLLEWTDNPAWCFYDIITNQRYGLGKYIGMDNVDKWTLYDISRYCDQLVPDGYGGLEPRFSCNVYINSKDEAFKVINDMASIFQGISYYGNGFIYAIQDKEREPITTFTTANVKDGNFTYSSSSKKTRHTVAVVRYNDKNNFYKPTIEYVEDIDSIQLYGIRELDLTSFGTTNRGQAVRFGRWALASEKYQTDTVSFITSYEAMYLKPGDIINIYDQNRKVGRLAGRILNVYNNTEQTKTTVLLDSDILTQNILNQDWFYTFNVLVPDYNYEPTLVTEGLTSEDSKEIRKSFIYSGEFKPTDHAVNVSGKTQISFDRYMPLQNNLPIWSIESSSGDLGSYSAEQYSIINIQEKETNEFNVSALLYVSKKYLEIDSGLNFERTRDYYLTAPQTNSAISLNTYLENNTQNVGISFATSNYSGTTNFHIFGKFGEFIDNNVPGKESLIGVVPTYSPIFSHAPSGTGQFYVRVYGYNDLSNQYGQTYMSGDATISKYYPIKNVRINNLELLDVDNFTGSYHNSGFFSGVDPKFVWRSSLIGKALDSINYNYRITVRDPSSSNIPTGTIRYEKIDILYTQNPEFIFDFDTNASISGGPFRSFDFVVEAIDIERNTSAGNYLAYDINNISQSTETWTNSFGYEVFYASNDRPEAVSLSFPESIPTGNYISNQWIDQNGSIHIKFISGHFPSDIAGAYVFSSTGLFSGIQITGMHISGASGSLYPIYTGECEFNSKSKYIISPAQLNHAKTGYVALAFYDVFDEAARENGVNIVSGLNISNVIPIVPSGYDFNMTIGNKLDIKNPSNNGDITSIITTRSGGYWIAKALNRDGIEYIIASRSDE